MSAEAEDDGAGPSGTTPQASEALACVSCRARKLKCDRTTPACSRCVRISNDCVYPESRRKPAFKRKNVRELEARLAQVEVLLKNAGKSDLDQDRRASSDGVEATFTGSGDEFAFESPVNLESMSGEPPFAPCSLPMDPFLASASSQPGLGHGGDTFTPMELIALGMTEAPPPLEVTQELHKTYFRNQSMFIPIVHSGRYLKAFHSAPHLRPPMCLQYAIWAMAANGHPKYSTYHEIFYRRARQYLQDDELKGHGEYFITVAHAQAWALTATYEARCLLFTRSAMSSSRCVRLIHMMGLHRLDTDNVENELSPTLAPPADWAELEERRRILWGAFCIDSHASISTGWPTLIDHTIVATHLPASEEAFATGKEERSHSLDEAFSGMPYSAFASSVMICHVFNMILKHKNTRKPDDRPEDFEYGGYWNRHRQLDTTLSSAFMFMPESFRLPKNIRNPVAVHTNLNLHASVICLHNAACEEADKYKLPPHLKQASEDRRLTAAHEIVSIMKLTSHINQEYRSPLVSLSLYCATSVCILQAQKTKEPRYTTDLEFLVKCMEAIGRDHLITRAFLQQALLDIDRNHVATTIKVPWFDAFAQSLSPCGHNIPLLARSSVSRHSKIQPPLPGRLPLGQPMGNAFGRHTGDCCPAGTISPAWNPPPPAAAAAAAETTGAKRRRLQSPDAGAGPSSVAPRLYAGAGIGACSDGGPGLGLADHIATSSPPTPASAALGAFLRTKLAHRTGASPASSSGGGTGSGGGSGALDTPSSASEAAAAAAALDGHLDSFTAALEDWDVADGEAMYAQLVEAVRSAGGVGAFGLEGGDPWVGLGGGDGGGGGAGWEGGGMGG